jgi:hypothetical protein
MLSMDQLFTLQLMCKLSSSCCCTTASHGQMISEISCPQIIRFSQADEKAAVAAGKAPYFMSKAEKRKRLLVAQYEELKASGQLDKYMEKRRKKNAAKDHRYLPSKRRSGTSTGGGQ